MLRVAHGGTASNMRALVIIDSTCVLHAMRRPDAPGYNHKKSSEGFVVQTPWLAQWCIRVDDLVGAEFNGLPLATR